MTTAQDYSQKSNFEEEKILAIRKLDRKTRKKIYSQLGLKTTTQWIQKGAPNTYGPMRDEDDWFRNFDKAYIRKDLEYSVMIGLAYSELFGDVAHVFIRQRDEKPVSWAEKQAIKNDFFGEEAQAIEVFPKGSKLVDQANTYHLWVVAPDIELPNIKG